MKFKRSRYPDIPGREQYASPCWTLTGRWIWADADWNTRFPFGTSFGVRVGPKAATYDEHRLPPWGFTLDVNAPLGEPNRLYVWGPKRNYMIGLVSWHTQIETGTRQQIIMGREQTVHEMKTVRCRPRLERGQTWDWKRSEGSDRWRWITVHPNDQHERWARAHPEEAAAVEERRRQREARRKEAR